MTQLHAFMASRVATLTDRTLVVAMMFLAARLCSTTLLSKVISSIYESHFVQQVIPVAGVAQWSAAFVA